MILDYTRSGQGVPVVLVHGLGSARTIWKLITPELSRNHDVIAVDLPGHGTSAFPPDTAMSPRDLADHVRETLDALGLDRVHLVGNSLGGWTVLEFAAAFPARTLSVVALAPAGMRQTPLLHGDWRLKFNRRLARALRPFIGLLVRYPRLRALGFARNSPIWQTWSQETCLDAARAMAGARGYDAALSGTFGKVASCTAQIPEQIPVTIIFGDTDNTLPPHTSQSRQYLPPHAQWVTWDKCGHAIQLDYPQRTVKAIESVVASR